MTDFTHGTLYQQGPNLEKASRDLVMSLFEWREWMFFKDIDEHDPQAGCILAELLWQKEQSA